jgi:hypothetical protein
MVVAGQMLGGSAGGSAAGASNPPDVFVSAERQLGQKLQPGLSGYWHWGQKTADRSAPQ